MLYPAGGFGPIHGVRNTLEIEATDRVVLIQLPVFYSDAPTQRTA